MANIDVSKQYIQIYDAFTGANITDSIPADSALWTSAQALFMSRLKAFDTAYASGNFPSSPTANLNEWYNYSANLKLNPTYSPTNQTTQDSTVILGQVMASLIAMIGVIQSVAAAQSAQLNFLAQWQSSYTNVLNQVHIFAAGDGTSLGGSTSNTPNKWNDTTKKTPLSNARSNLNSVNQNYITKLQGEQSNVSDTSKQVQTNVNQSSDAANQESSILNSILQEMSTIVTSIFQSS